MKASTSWRSHVIQGVNQPALEGWKGPLTNFKPTPFTLHDNSKAKEIKWLSQGDFYEGLD